MMGFGGVGFGPMRGDLPRRQLSRDPTRAVARADETVQAGLRCSRERSLLLNRDAWTRCPTFRGRRRRQPSMTAAQRGMEPGSARRSCRENPECLGIRGESCKRFSARSQRPCCSPSRSLCERASRGRPSSLRPDRHRRFVSAFPRKVGQRVQASRFKESRLFPASICTACLYVSSVASHSTRRSRIVVRRGQVAAHRPEAKHRRSPS